MIRLSLVVALVACGVAVEECPTVVAWYPEGADACGYTVRTIPDDADCPRLLSQAEDGCAYTQERACLDSARAIEHVDPRRAFASIELTRGECVARFEGPLVTRP